MEATFRMTWRDRLVGYNAGLTHMTLLYRLIWGGILLLVIAGLGSIPWGAVSTAMSPPTGGPRRLLVFAVGLFSVSLAGCAPAAVLSWCLTKRRTVKIRHDCLENRRLFGWNAIPWWDVTDIIVTSDHICFCQNVPTAVIVPAVAFVNPEQAQAFLEQAEHFWRRATGRRDLSPPDAAGVWPPAPHR